MYFLIDLKEVWMRVVNICTVFVLAFYLFVFNEGLEAALLANAVLNFYFGSLSFHSFFTAWEQFRQPLSQVESSTASFALQVLRFHLRLLFFNGFPSFLFGLLFLSLQLYSFILGSKLSSFQ